MITATWSFISWLVFFIPRPGYRRPRKDFLNPLLCRPFAGNCNLYPIGNPGPGVSLSSSYPAGTATGRLEQKNSHGRLFLFAAVTGWVLSSYSTLYQILPACTL